MMIGKKLRHYEILEQLGSGSMGDVYLAMDQKLDRRIALKVLSPETASDPDRLQRFRREAQAVAALNHPNIVVLHSVEKAGDLHFLTMELVDGKTLAEVIPREGFTLRRLFELALPLTEALVVAHDRGITHRDLKPANIMVGADGRLRVLDFGLAKRSPADGGSWAQSRDMTVEGMVLGTIPYMSPEQVEGRAVDHRTDIFALGVILYEMATGRHPFADKSGFQLIAAILKDAVPAVDAVRPDLPRQLARIVGRCIAKDPERRYQTVKDVRNELEELRDEVDSAVAPGLPSAAVPAAASSRFDGAATATIYPSSASTLRSPRIRYAQTAGGVSIAFWSVGSGLPLILMPNHPFSHIQREWELTPWYAYLSQICQLIRYDGRGTGLSDRDVTENPMRGILEDLEAVVAELGLERFALMGFQHTGPPAIDFAARHPERVSHLLLWNTYARAEEYFEAPVIKALAGILVADWEMFSHTLAGAALGWGEGAAVLKWGALIRDSTSEGFAKTALREAAGTDVTELLARVRAPTLVIHRRQNRMAGVRPSRNIAARIPDARLVSLEGEAYLPFAGGFDEVLHAIEEHLGLSPVEIR
jgi:serine/threonine protein kinase